MVELLVWLPAIPGVPADLVAQTPDTYFRPLDVGATGWVGIQLSKVMTSTCRL